MIYQSDAAVTHTVVKLSRNAPERHSSSFLDAGTTDQNFWTGPRRHAKEWRQINFFRCFRHRNAYVTYMHYNKAYLAAHTVQRLHPRERHTKYSYLLVYSSYRVIL